MKVIYSRPIFERITEAIETAENLNRPIEKIVLTNREGKELWDACGASVVDVYPRSPLEFLTGKTNAVVSGVTVEVEKS